LFYTFHRRRKRKKFFFVCEENSIDMIANGMGAACKKCCELKTNIKRTNGRAKRGGTGKRNFAHAHTERTMKRRLFCACACIIQNNHTQTKDEEKYVFITLTLTHLKHDGSLKPGDATVRRRTFPVSTLVLSSSHCVCDRKNPREVFGLLAEKSHQK